jgi:hypothetical protein
VEVHNTMSGWTLTKGATAWVGSVVADRCLWPCRSRCVPTTRGWRRRRRRSGRDPRASWMTSAHFPSGQRSVDGVEEAGQFNCWVTEATGPPASRCRSETLWPPRRWPRAECAGFWDRRAATQGLVAGHVGGSSGQPHTGQGRARRGVDGRRQSGPVLEPHGQPSPAGTFSPQGC